MTTPFSPVPEYAVLGHPNEGKSSLVSTLSEDDTVRISPWPGETTECRAFPVCIDGCEILRFIDTPGFQNPRQTLSWFETCPEHGLDKVRAFIDENRNDPQFKDECELFKPLARGAGILFVVDGSRPLRSGDRCEMAILKLTGLPRMAVINSKAKSPDFTETWLTDLKLHFQHVAVFNAHTASFRSRLTLLSELKTIDILNQNALTRVIQAFDQEWNRRSAVTTERIMDLLDKAMNHTVTWKTDDKALKDEEKKRLKDTWASDIRTMEQETHQAIRALYRHNIFNIDLPPRSPAAADLFDRETWKILGLSRTELAASAATVGAVSAATLDLALAGHSLGLFAAVGGVVGACSALFAAKKIGRVNVLGRHLGAYKIKVGPLRNLQFMMILIDRALIFHSHIINWTHGRRDPGQGELSMEYGQHPSGLVASFESSTTRIFAEFFSSFSHKDRRVRASARKKAVIALTAVLQSIS